MYCEKCGKELEQGAKFCGGCGTPVSVEKKIPEIVDKIQEKVIDKVSNLSDIQSEQKSTNGEAPEEDYSFRANLDPINDLKSKNSYSKAEGEAYKEIFISADEKYISSLRKSYIQSIVTGYGLASGLVVLSDRRVYYHGEKYDLNDGITKGEEQVIVNLEDVTGSGFLHLQNLKALIKGILFAIFAFIAFILAAGADEGVIALVAFGLMVISIVDFIKYFLSRKTLFIVYFAGGSFAFDAGLYHMSGYFHKELRRAKDLREQGIAEEE